MRIRVRNDWGKVLEELPLAQDGDRGTVIVSIGNATSVVRIIQKILGETTTPE